MYILNRFLKLYARSALLAAKLWTVAVPEMPTFTHIIDIVLVEDIGWCCAIVEDARCCGFKLCIVRQV